MSSYFQKCTNTQQSTTQKNKRNYNDEILKKTSLIKVTLFQKWNSKYKRVKRSHELIGQLNPRYFK